jgi:hypothetical protein
MNIERFEVLMTLTAPSTASSSVSEVDSHMIIRKLLRSIFNIKVKLTL